MLNSILGSIQINFLTIAIFGFLSVFLGSFLFWRAGRRELVESNLLFDIFFVGTAGYLIGGRIFDFLLGLFSYSFSVKRLLFFNAYGGFNFYGALFGLLLAVYIFLKRENYKFLPIFDLMAAPIAFARAIFLFGLVVANFGRREGGNSFSSALILFSVYFTCFWAIKRFERKKRFDGFFIGYYLIFTSIFEIVLAFLWGNPPFIIRNVPVNVLLPVLFLALGLGIWYFEGKGKKKINSRSFFAIILLGLFKVRRVLTSLPEADQLAKAIVLSPYTLAKLLLNFVKLTVREILISFVDLFRAFGFKKG